MSATDTQSGDRLIWLAGAVVVAMSLGWLLVESPWSIFDAPAPLAVTTDRAAAPAPAPAVPASAAQVPPNSAPGNADETLHLAELALEAGMLVEPEDYSAWSLFTRVADADPDNAAAHEGLEKVVAALLGRGQTALEQGRYDDASAVAATILARMPGQAGALELEAAIVEAKTPAEPVAVAPPELPAVAPPAVVAPVDPIPELNEAFMAAMAENALLTPPGANARDILTDMLARAPEHALTAAARDLLVTEMLSRSTQSIEAHDTVAARTWIDSAAPLAADPKRIARARDALRQYQIDTESQKLVPATELKQLHYVAPGYPLTAQNRGLEGWVEVEFTVSITGKPENLKVLDASNDHYFREEALAAVAQWRFEPVVFMGEAIPKRAYARLAFVLN